MYGQRIRYISEVLCRLWRTVCFNRWRSLWYSVWKQRSKFQATRDLDMVLLVEALTPEFGEKFWKFIVDGKYRNKATNGSNPQFYRFNKPEDDNFPKMIELFYWLVGAGTIWSKFIEKIWTEKWGYYGIVKESIRIKVLFICHGRTMEYQTEWTGMGIIVKRY